LLVTNDIILAMAENILCAFLDLPEAVSLL